MPSYKVLGFAAVHKVHWPYVHQVAELASYLACSTGNYMKPIAHADRPGAHAQEAPPPRHTTTAETLTAVPTPLREDLPEKPRMLSRLEMLNTVGPDFARTPLRHVAPSRDGELLFRAAASHSLLEIVRDGFLKPPAAGLAACHRLAVFDFATATGVGPPAPAIRVSHIVSQTDVVRWLAKRVSDGTAGRLPGAKLLDLGLTPKHVVCVSADEPAIDAYAKLLQSNLAAAAVCTSGGAVVASLHLALLNGISADKLGVLALPVGEFLALRHSTVWGSASGRPPSPGAGGAAGLSRRDTLMQQHALVSVTADATLGAVIDLLATRHARAVFVVDEAHKPLSVVTPTDVLRVATEEHGPATGDVALPPPQQQ